MPIDERERARLTAALPAHGAIRSDAHDLAKMRLAEAVLAYHGRRGLITFAIIDVAPAFVGVYERAVILVSARALPIVKDEEFAALVAHEIGHEYVWLDYERALQRRDHARIRKLELRWDGIAGTDLAPLGSECRGLVRAVELLTWYNRSRGLDANWRDYVSLNERRTFIHALDNLQWTERGPVRPTGMTRSAPSSGTVTASLGNRLSRRFRRQPPPGNRWCCHQLSRAQTFVSS